MNQIIRHSCNITFIWSDKGYDTTTASQQGLFQGSVLLQSSLTQKPWLIEEICNTTWSPLYIHFKGEKSMIQITRGSVGWACAAHLSFCFEETLYRTFVSYQISI
jgi:hypothetical protein